MQNINYLGIHQICIVRIPNILWHGWFMHSNSLKQNQKKKLKRNKNFNQSHHGGLTLPKKYHSKIII